MVYLVLDVLERRELLSVRQTKQYMMYLAALLLILQSGLRNVAVGPDTYAYSLKFVDSLSTTWREIIQDFLTVYVDDEGKDPGYYFIQKTFSSLIPDFQCFLLFIAGVFFWGFFSVVGHYTSTKMEIFLAVFLYLALFFEFFSVTGCRQVLATAFCLFSVKYIREKKWLPYLALMLVAFTIHRSSLIFLPFYFLSRNRKPEIVFLVSLALMPLLIVFSTRYVTELALLSGTDVYLMYAEEETSGAGSFLLFYLAICFFLFLIQRRIVQEDKAYLLIYNAIYFALLFIPLTYSSAALMRVVQYYSLFMTVGISFFIKKHLRKEEHRIYKIGKHRFYIKRSYILVYMFLAVSLLALSYKLLGNNIEYKFFWQYMELPMNYF